MRTKRSAFSVVRPRGSRRVQRSGSAHLHSSFILHPSSFSPAFTLIEVTLAIAVVAIGLVGILALFPLGLRATRGAMDSTQMATIAQEYIAKYQMAALTNANYDTVYPTNVLAQSNATYTVMIESNVTYTVNVVVTNSGFPQMTSGVNTTNYNLLSRVIIQISRPGSKTNTYVTEVARYALP